MFKLPSVAFGYVVALFGTVLVVFARSTLFDHVPGGDAPLLLFVVVVMLSAWIGGFWPGLLATVLSALLGTYFFIDPERSLVVPQVRYSVRVALFIVIGVLISALCHALYATQRRLKARPLELEQEIKVRRGAEAALRENQQKLQLAIDVGRFGAWELDLKTRTIQATTETKAHFGVAPDEPLDYQRLVSESIHPEDRPGMEDAIRRAVVRRADYHAEYRVIWPDRSLHWIVTRGRAIYGDDDKPLRMAGVTLDVTARRQAEEDLKLSNLRYQLVSQAANDAIWDWNLVTNEVTWNEGVRTLFGYRENGVEPTANWWHEHIHPEDRERIVEGIHKSIDGGDETWSDEYRLVRADGSHAYVFDRGRIVRDAGGKPVRMVGAMLDLTERKAAEAALRRSEEHIRIITDSVPFLISHIGADLRYRFANKTYRSWFGKGAEDIVGKKVSDVVGAPAYDKVRRHLEAALAGETVAFEAEIPYERGMRWIQAVYTPDVDSEGRMHGFFTAVADISHEKAAVVAAAKRNLQLQEAHEEQEVIGEELRANNEELVAARQAIEAERARYRDLFESAPDGYLVTDADGFILQANIAAAELFQMAALQLAGQPLREFVRGPDRGQFRHRLEALQRAQLPESWETCLGADDDKTFDALLSVTVIRKGHREPGDLRWLVRDISESKRAARALAESEQRARQANEALADLNRNLEQRVAERTSLAEQRAAQLRALTLQLSQAETSERRRIAQMLHDDLQQMLMSTKLHLNVLKKRAPEADITPVADMLDQSIQASRSLATELSPPILHQLDLAAALRWLAEREKAQRGLDVDLRVTGDPPELDETLKVLLYQAVRELLLNILKHAGVTSVRIRLHGRSDNFMVRVEDKGAGFDVTKLRNRAGAGFGLFSISERLEALGGIMNVRSQPGHGTRVSLIVPVKAAAAIDIDSAKLPRPTLVRAPRPLGMPIRVLVVDDHPLVREGMRGVVQAETDMTVVGEAEDGQRAVELAAALHPDVVLMDINMPVMNGIEATRRIKAGFPHIYVVGVSMHDDEAVMQSMRDAGACDYVTKDAVPNILCQTIRARMEMPQTAEREPRNYTKRS